MKTPMFKSVFLQSNGIKNVIASHECTLEVIYSGLRQLLWPNCAPRETIVGVMLRGWSNSGRYVKMSGPAVSWE